LPKNITNKKEIHEDGVLHEEGKRRGNAVDGSGEKGEWVRKIDGLETPLLSQEVRLRGGSENRYLLC
jgi:hypothetical protein